MAGLIHEKLDIKILILYILKRMPGPVEGEVLFDMCAAGGGVEYFDYSDCLNELIATDHINVDEDGLYSITAKGIRNEEQVEGSLPFSARKATDKAIRPEAERISRANLIVAESLDAAGGKMVHLALSDGEGDLINLKLLVADDAQATRIRKNFRRNAEKYYSEIIEMMT